MRIRALREEARMGGLVSVYSGGECGNGRDGYERMASAVNRMGAKQKVEY